MQDLRRVAVRRTLDLPFRLGDSAIMIVKSLPALECDQCGDTELENQVMTQVDRLLAKDEPPSEVVRFAA